MLEDIESKMEELSKKIEYEFKDISLLKKAMDSTKIQGKKKEHSNQCLATVGDAVLKLLISDYLFYIDKISTKGELTEKKKELENNKVLYKIVTNEEIINFAFNDKHFYSKENPQHEKVALSKHDSYLEAIIGAIFYDGGFEKTKIWFENWLYPILEKYKK